jgi:hypothetical protein
MWLALAAVCEAGQAGKRDFPHSRTAA